MRLAFERRSTCRLTIQRGIVESPLRSLFRQRQWRIPLILQAERPSTGVRVGGKDIEAIPSLSLSLLSFSFISFSLLNIVSLLPLNREIHV